MRPFNNYGTTAASSGVQIFTEPDHRLVGTTTDCVSCVKFSPKECPANILGVTSWDCSCSVWQVANGPNGVQSTPSWTTTVEAPPLCMSFSNDGRAFIGGCSKNVTQWNLQTNQKNVVATHDLPVSALTYLSIPNVMNDLLVTGSWDGKLRWWDLRTPTPIKEENLCEPIFALDAQRSVPMMAVATGRVVHVYNLQTMTKVDEILPPDPVKFNFRCVSCAPDYQGVAFGGVEGRISFGRMDKSQGCTFKAHQLSQGNTHLMYQTNFCVHHPQRPLVLTGGGDGSLFCMDRESRREVCTFPAKEKHMNENIPISAGDISADGTLIAYAHSYDWSAGKDGYKNQPTSVHIRRLNV